MRGAFPSLPNTPAWHGAQLFDRDNFKTAEGENVFQVMADTRTYAVILKACV